MDFSKFKTSDWLKVGGALAFFIFGFFDWVTAEFDGSVISADGAGGNVFDFFWTGILPWILILGTGVITVLLITGTIKPGKAPFPLVFLAATGLALLLVLIRVLFNPLEDSDAFEALGGE